MAIAAISFYLVGEHLKNPFNGVEEIVAALLALTLVLVTVNLELLVLTIKYPSK